MPPARRPAARRRRRAPRRPSAGTRRRAERRPARASPPSGAGERDDRAEEVGVERRVEDEAAGAAARRRRRARAGSASPTVSHIVSSATGYVAGSSEDAQQPRRQPGQGRPTGARRKDADTPATIAQRPERSAPAVWPARGRRASVACWLDEERPQRRAPSLAARGRPRPAGRSPAARGPASQRRATRLVEAKAAGEGRDEVLQAAGRRAAHQRRAAARFPGGPSRAAALRPRRAEGRAAHLRVRRIDPRFHDRPGVEFMVKVRRGDREDDRLDAAPRPDRPPRAPRLWIPVDVDLARYAGARPRAGPRDARLRGDRRRRRARSGARRGDRGRGARPRSRS